MGPNPSGPAENPVSKTWKYFVLLICLFGALTALSLAYRINVIREDRYTLAVSTGKILFRTIVATRSWVSGHGGVYVPVTDTMRPNPHLAGADRDIRTTSGRELTKVNPAYMTRLVADVLKRDGYVVHITSLKTLRPGNQPGEWERTALGRFDKGSRFEHGLAGPSGARIFQYMEPLMTESSCLACHGNQGYRVGDVRGGISIAFPYEPFEKSIAVGIRETVFTHIAFFLAFLGALVFSGSRVASLVKNLEDARREIRTLEGIFPICSFCKKIRKEGADSGDRTQWVPVDSYITDRSQAKFSHSICPECMKEQYGPGGSFGFDR